MATASELKPSTSIKRSLRSSSSIKHANEWPISDVSSDITIVVGASTFALHKVINYTTCKKNVSETAFFQFPLVSRSGKMRKLVQQAKELKSSQITMHSVPGDAEGFELAAKFCYGVHFDITVANVATVCCVARFLEMTEDYAEKNMEARADAFLKDVVFPNTLSAISVLHRCQRMMPISEEVGLVDRIVNAISSNISKEQLASVLLKLNAAHEINSATAFEFERSFDVLSVDFFHRAVSAMKMKGLYQETLVKILINYVHHFAQEGGGESEKNKKVLVEVVVGLLPTPTRSNHVPTSFLAILLKSSSPSSACRSEIERRIGLQLDDATLEDILILRDSEAEELGMYDTEFVERIFSFFLKMDEEEDSDYGSPNHSSIIKVSVLLDSYLVEVAIDPNMTASKFIALAELLPDHARSSSDYLYRSVDIFLKVHPSTKDGERYRLCKTIDCQKLSQEMCNHAARNERLPVQMAVQVLYYEQIKLRNAINGGENSQLFGSNMTFSHRSGSGIMSPKDNYASVRRENRELKMEVARMRMRLTELEKEHVSMKQEMMNAHGSRKIFKMFTRKLRQINAVLCSSSFRSVRSSKSEFRLLFLRCGRHSTI